MEQELKCPKCKKIRTIFRREETKPETRFYCEDCHKMVVPDLSS